MSNISRLGHHCTYDARVVKALGLQAAIFYQYLLGKTLYMDEKGEIQERDWVPMPVKEVERNTGLKRRRQETARRTLVESGWIDEKVTGNPPTLHCIVL